MKRKLLLAALCAVGCLGVNSAQAQGWTASAPANGDFYLYNVGANKFLTNGTSWDTHAALSTEGFIVNLTYISDGVYTIGTNAKYSERYFTDNGYVDTSSSTNWTFEPVAGEPETYKIKTANNYYIYATAGLCNVEFANEATDNKFYWKLVTSANKAAATIDLSGASALTPVDVTSLIKNPCFDTNVDSWEGTAPGRGGNAGTNGNVASWNDYNPCAEHYNKTYDTYQTITDLTNGIYGVRVQGFYRNGGYDAAAAARDNGTEALNAILYANSKEVPLKSILEDAGKATGGNLVNSGSFNGIPDNMVAASYFFSAGLYENVAYVEVTDGTLKIGVKKSASVSADWTIFDNFRLEYYGTATTVAALENAALIVDYNAAKANALAVNQEAIMQASVLTDLQAAITTYGSLNTETASAEQLTTATTALNSNATLATASIAAYANAKAYIDRMEGYLTGANTYTNFYTTTAYNTYFGDIKTAYENRTMTTAVGSPLSADVAYQSGTTWHKVNNLDNILLSTWKQGETQCNEFAASLYLNTWSIEGNTDGSEFYAPFYEYWVSSGNVLAANTFTSTITGLKANTTYSVTIRCRVQPTNNQTKIDNAVTMKVGEGEATCISAGAKFGATNYYIGNFSAVGQTDAEGNLVTTITVAENSNISWLSFYNVRYTEGEDLSAYIADYEFALANAQAAQSKPMDPTKKSALDEAVTTYTTVDKTNKAALIAAKEVLEAALTAANPSIAALAGTSVESWTKTNANGALAANTWSNEGDTDGSNMTKPFAQLWIGKGTALADGTISYTMTGQTPGYYKLTGLVRSLNEAGGATPAGTFIFANDAIERAYIGSTCTNGVYSTPTVYGLVGEDGNLTIGFKIIKGNVNWISWKNLSIEYVGTGLNSDIATNQAEEARTFENATSCDAATAQDAAVTALETLLSDDNYTAAGRAIEAAYNAIDRNFSALQAAISAAESKLGFEAGEYAPYNVAAPLAAAKAISQTSEANTQTQIDDATTALTNVAKNSSEVNAIYWDYSTMATTEKSKAYGWYDPALSGNAEGSMYSTRVFNHVESNSGLAAVTDNVALFTKVSTNYGKVEGYTLPLKANRIYKLSFKYAGWGEPSESTISITDENGENPLSISGVVMVSGDAQNGNSNTDVWADYEGYFTVPENGNYVLNINRINMGNNVQRQLVMGNIDLRTATELEFADGSVPTYAPGTYPTVKISRSLTANKWATAVYPFAVSGVDNIAVLNSFTSETGVLGFTSADASTANTPFLMRSTDGATEITLSNVEVAAASATDATANEASLKGTYTATDITNAEKNYVLSNNTIYAVGEKGATINPYRAYIQIAQPVEGGEAKALRFVIDGEDATAIEGIAAETGNVLLDGQVYDMSGRLVKNPTKGLYIVNGKKVLVK